MLRCNLSFKEMTWDVLKGEEKSVQGKCSIRKKKEVVFEEEIFVFNLGLR